MSLPTHALKSDARLDWVKQKFDTIVEEKAYKSSFDQSSGEEFIYYPVGKIVVEEGGWEDPSAVKAAKVHTEDRLQYEKSFI